MNVVKIVRWVAKTSAGIGASIIIGNAIAATTPPVVSKLEKVLIYAGSFALGMVVGNAAEDVTVDFIDSLVGSYQRVTGTVTATIIKEAELLDPLNEDN
jgi:hypothetical protein